MEEKIKSLIESHIITASMLNEHTVVQVLEVLQEQVLEAMEEDLNKRKEVLL